jgi:TPR repeat protein
MKRPIAIAMRASLVLVFLAAMPVAAQDLAIARDSASPTSQARPGEYFFFEGVKAVKDGDYRHAVYMYKIASSWAYKKAEYNLGVIFANGEGGVHTDLPQALAWMTLAAEREDGSNEHKMYVAAREKVRNACDPGDIESANRLLADPSMAIYADEHALVRAKAKWNEVRHDATGSHLGFTGNLTVSSSQASGYGHVATKGATQSGFHSAGEMTAGAGTDGSIAYRELRDSDNPYDAKFDLGNVTVGDVETLAKPAEAPKPATAAPTKQ